MEFGELRELDRTRAIFLLLYWRAMTNMAPPYAPASAIEPTAMPIVLAFWLDEVLPLELFSKTSPPLLLEDPVPELPEPLDEPEEEDPPALSPTLMPMAELICCEMLYRSCSGSWYNLAVGILMSKARVETMSEGYVQMARVVTKPYTL